MNKVVPKKSELAKLIQYVRALERDGIGLDRASTIVNENSEVQEAYQALSEETRRAIES